MQTIGGTRMAARAMLLLAGLVMICVTGCGGPPKHFDDPVTVMLNKEEGMVPRWAAAAQAEKELPSDPKRIKALQRIVWERGYPADWSNYAVDQLLAQDEAAARKFLGTSIVLVNDWDTTNYIIDLAVNRNWTDFVPALVRSYARTSAGFRDVDRPERKAIEKLAPGKSLEQVVMEVFAADPSRPIEQRAAAWQLLYRLGGDHAKMQELLLAQPARGNDPLLLDLQWAARDLGVIPINLETITWARMLRTEPYRAFAESATKAVAKLGPEQRLGLELRHLPILVFLDYHEAAVLGRSRAELLAEAQQFVAGQQHHLKGPTFDGPMDEHPQELRNWQEKLCWADLATLHVVERVMADRRVVGQWFEQGDADVADESTEYGGLVRVSEKGEPLAQKYSPMMRENNYKYYPPKELAFDAYTALAHYHFHAQEYKNRRYAGPGIGDLDMVKRQQFGALVLTFIDKDKINVDYYQAPEIVIDMGTISR